jgi:hypothetical protein
VIPKIYRCELFFGYWAITKKHGKKMPREQSNAVLMKQILDELLKIKSDLPNGEFKRMQDGIEDLKKDQKSLKDDISDLKKKLLDPEDGVIVKVNENTKFRIQEEDRYEEYLQFNADMKHLKRWQGGVNKALWIIFGALVALAFKVVFRVG